MSGPATESVGGLTEIVMSNGSVPNIALRAYQLWEAAGRPEGRDEEFYFQAEEELRKLVEAENPKEGGEK